MGQLLSLPETEKTIVFNDDQSNIAYAIGEMQGYRLTMEDSHCESTFEITLGESTIKINIFGVFDGHGGSNVSKYISQALPTIIYTELQSQFRSLQSKDDIKQIDLPNLIKKCYLQCDKELFKRDEKSGSTLIVIVIIDDLVISANTGDSRCIYSYNGIPKTMSFDHKPNNYGELLRIHQDKGYVSYNRVNGILALSRLFGDFYLKTNNSIKPPQEYKVTVEPELILHNLNLMHDEFLVLACDGIWDCFNNKDLIKFIRHNLSLGYNLSKILELLLDKCLKLANTITGIGFDNMTIFIILLLRENEKIDDWYMRMKTKILNEKFGEF